MCGSKMMIGRLMRKDSHSGRIRPIQVKCEMQAHESCRKKTPSPSPQPAEAKLICNAETPASIFNGYSEAMYSAAHIYKCKYFAPKYPTQPQWTRVRIRGSEQINAELLGLIRTSLFLWADLTIYQRHQISIKAHWMNRID